MRRTNPWVRPLGASLLLGLPLLAAPASAQVAAKEDNPLAAVLFEPELVMQHRRAIGLTDEQRDAMSRMIQELQGRVVRLQWELLDEMETLKGMLERPRVDQDRALDQLERVLETEKRIKRDHLELLIRIKNVLTPEQQRELARLRDRDAGGASAPGGAS
jgi:Spy/CpxP family protein refolding chaperone